MMWRWLVLVVVFGVALARYAWADDGGAGSITLDIKTLGAIGTGLAAILAPIAGAMWRWWPRSSRETHAHPPVEASTLPPQPVPRDTTIIRKEIKLEELQKRITELLPQLERVDWDTLDNLGERLEHLERLIGSGTRPTD